VDKVARSIYGPQTARKIKSGCFSSFLMAQNIVDRVASSLYGPQKARKGLKLKSKENRRKIGDFNGKNRY
jgi:hypothetical protein